MSIRRFALVLFAACAFVPVLGLASELIEMRLSSLSMAGEGGEKLTVGRVGERLTQLRLEDAGGEWQVPAGALDIAFMPDIAATQFFRYDQRGKRGFYVRFSGSFVAGNKHRAGQLAFEFLDGRLVAREIWEHDGSGFELSKSEPF